MGQRVKIQYSVELEDLEKEVDRLYKNILNETDVFLKEKDSPEIKLETSGLDKIHSLRQSLTKMDIMLDDLQQIIEGYIRYRVPVGPEQNLQAIADQINKFKDSVSENTD